MLHLYPPLFSLPRSFSLNNHIIPYHVRITASRHSPLSEYMSCPHHIVRTMHIWLDLCWCLILSKTLLCSSKLLQLQIKTPIVTYTMLTLAATKCCSSCSPRCKSFLHLSTVIGLLFHFSSPSLSSFLLSIPSSLFRCHSSCAFICSPFSAERDTLHIVHFCMCHSSSWLACLTTALLMLLWSNRMTSALLTDSAAWILLLPLFCCFYLFQTHLPTEHTFALHTWTVLVSGLYRSPLQVNYCFSSFLFSVPRIL